MKTLLCLEKIIGLSTNPCPCYDDGRPTDYNESNSGLFLDELDGLELKMIGGDIECGENDIWEKMIKSLDNAKINYRKDLLKCIGETSGMKRKPFYGIIGLTEWNQSIVVGTDYLGVKLEGCNIKGGEFTLNGINTLMDANAVFDIEVYNNISPTPLLTKPNINAVADTITENIFASDPLLTFPMYSEECDNLEYYIVYKPVGFAPRNNDVTCGCSRRPEWEKWIDVDGIAGNLVSGIEDWSTSPKANGLFLNIQFNCNVSDLICGGTNAPVDFENDDVAMSMAYAIRYDAGRSLIDNILGSGRINSYTMLPSESLWNLRNHFVERYENLILYICQETDITSNGCLMCDDKRIGLRSILT